MLVSTFSAIQSIIFTDRVHTHSFLVQSVSKKSKRYRTQEFNFLQNKLRISFMILIIWALSKILSTCAWYIQNAIKILA